MTTKEKTPEIKLTAKQEKFAQLWFSLSNKSEAYRQAYNAENMSEEAIHVQACEVSKNHKVAVRYSELVDLARKDNQTTVDTLDQMAKKAYEKAEETNTPSAMNQSVTVLAKLHGLNQPEKQDINHNGLPDVNIYLPDNNRDGTES